MAIDSKLSYFQKNLFRPFSIAENPVEGLSLIVVIPCFNEPEVTSVLNSLALCKPPSEKTEVIVVVNDSEHSSNEIREINLASLRILEEWKKSNQPFFRFHLIEALNLPDRHAGVGLARKIGMDEAASRLIHSGNPKGIIVCLDMDCEVEENYFTELFSHFFENPKSNACSIHFEHPLRGDLPEEHYSGIALYELFLRYYVNALQFAGFPFAFQTIGSSMAVRAEVYCKMGGMNRRKAGEDFYFLHKLFPLGNFTEIYSTTVIPSPRGSDRVPFGTGKAIRQWIEKGDENYPAYDFRIFRELKLFLDKANSSLYSTANIHQFLNELPDAVAVYLRSEDFEKAFAEMKLHSSEPSTFAKRFFAWFDGLRVLKYVHLARDKYYPAVSLLGEVALLADELDIEWKEGHSPVNTLNAFRLYDKVKLERRE